MSSTNVTTKHKSDRYTNKYDKSMPKISSSNIQIPTNEALLKKSHKLLQLSKQKRHIDHNKLKLMRHVFSSIINNSQSSEMKIFLFSPTK